VGDVLALTTLSKLLKNPNHLVSTEYLFLSSHTDGQWLTNCS